MTKILLVNIYEPTRKFLLQHLSDKEYGIFIANSNKRAWEMLSQGSFDAVILGHKPHRSNSFEQVRKLKESFSLPVVVISNQANIKNAIEAIKMGASDFLITPLKPLEVKKSLLSALESRKTILENIRLKRAFKDDKFSKLIGNSPAMQKIREQILQVAPTKSTVLILGESGTGKEVIAETIHNLSPRVGKPFVKVNCGALSKHLLESELFGHEKGPLQVHQANTKAGSSLQMAEPSSWTR